MADTPTPDPIRTMLKAEAHAALTALAELGQTNLDSATLARRLDALGSAWGNARRTAAWSTGMERGLDLMLGALREAHGLAKDGTMPASELGARVALVLADKTHPERPALLKAFAGALNAGHVVMKPPKARESTAMGSAWSSWVLVEGYRCALCQGPVRVLPPGGLEPGRHVCVNAHIGASELDPHADRPALRP